MQTISNVSLIDNSALTITVRPDLKGKIPKSLIEKLNNLTWTTVSYSGSTLIIDIEFKDPFDISRWVSSINDIILI